MSMQDQSQEVDSYEDDGYHQGKSQKFMGNASNHHQMAFMQHKMPYPHENFGQGSPQHPGDMYRYDQNNYSSQEYDS